MTRVEKIEYDRRYRVAHRERLKDYERKRRNRSERDRDPQKLAARYALRNAVKAGKITKPKACQDCGGRFPVQAHHTDYSKALDVYWLCQACHGRRHRS